MNEAERPGAEERDGPRPRSGGPLLTAEQVGEMLGVPRSWVWEQSRKGTIPTVRLGRYRRYRREALEEWVAGLEDEGRRGR
jgi:excisionase family DNA binding protein